MDAGNARWSPDFVHGQIAAASDLKKHDTVESFNGKMCEELLNETLFFSLDQARKAIAAWVEDLPN